MANVSAKVPFQQKSAASLDMDKTSRNKRKCSRWGTTARNLQASGFNLLPLRDFYVQLVSPDNCNL